jgi:hypothetical protein
MEVVRVTVLYLGEMQYERTRNKADKDERGSHSVIHRVHQIFTAFGRQKFAFKAITRSGALYGMQFLYYTLLSIS